jgi:hypothetical protein
MKIGRDAVVSRHSLWSRLFAGFVLAALDGLRRLRNACRDL